MPCCFRSARRAAAETVYSRSRSPLARHGRPLTRAEETCFLICNPNAMGEIYIGGSCNSSVLSNELRNKLGADALEVDFMFAHRQIVFQTLLVNASKRPQKIAGRRSQSFNCVDMDLSHSIAIVISGPLFLAVTSRTVGAIEAVVALPFIGVTGDLRLCVPLHVFLQRLTISMMAHSQATLPTLPANRPDNWRSIIVIRAAPTLLVGSSTWWIQRITVFPPFFPPRSETSHRFQSLHQATPSGLTSHTRWLGFSCATVVRTGGRATVPRIKRSQGHPCKPRALTTPRVGAQGCCPQKWSWYRG